MNTSSLLRLESVAKRSDPKRATALPRAWGLNCTMDNILALLTVGPGSILGIPKNVYRYVGETDLDCTAVNSGQRLDNVN